MQKKRYWSLLLSWSYQLKNSRFAAEIKHGTWNCAYAHAWGRQPLQLLLVMHQLSYLIHLRKEIRYQRKTLKKDYDLNTNSKWKFIRCNWYHEGSPVFADTSYKDTPRRVASFSARLKSTWKKYVRLLDFLHESSLQDMLTRKRM